MNGNLLRTGTPSSLAVDSVLLIPPIIATPPSLINSLVLKFLVEIAGGMFTLGVPKGVSLLTLISK